jgi:ribosomal protein L7/L12
MAFDPYLTDCFKKIANAEDVGYAKGVADSALKYLELNNPEIQIKILDYDNVIQGIKAVRECTSCTLKEAKDIVQQCGVFNIGRDVNKAIKKVNLLKNAGLKFSINEKSLQVLYGENQNI